VTSDADEQPASGSGNAPRTLVTLCTYNERENIARLIPEIRAAAPHADVLVIDDNSPDGTGALADEMAHADPQVHVLHRPAKEGLGVATMAGFRWGIERGYSLLVNMDADFSHPPRYIPDLLAKAPEFDVVIASRYVPGGGVAGWGAGRHFMSRGINAYARLMLGLRTKDNSGSFRCYRVSKLAAIPLGRIRSRGYAIQEEILAWCRAVGCRFTEVPFQFEERRYGESKINWKEAVGALWVLLQLRLRRPRI
jgi:dolichol-phosphate mannosyltransferase